jgi:ribose transport system substrate-binding protein
MRRSAAREDDVMAIAPGKYPLAAGLAAAGITFAVGADPATADPVAAAKALIEQAKSGLVASKDAKKAELTLTIDDFAPVTDWPGPKTSPKAPEHKKIVAIACATVAPFCANVSQGSVEAAKALGWDATYLDGKGSVQGFVQAFETAINAKPDAIVAMAIPESIVATYIAKAHAAGIKVIAASSIPEKISVDNGHYDAYVSVREDTNALLQAWFVIADSDGKAKITWMWDPGYPFLTAELDQQKKILSTDCPACKQGEVGLRELDAAANPVRMQQLGSGLLSRNADAQYILTAYGLNSHSLFIAAQSAGRQVKVVSKNNDPNNVAFVAQGQLYAEMGASSNWGGWAAMDQTVRVLAGEKPLDATEENQPEHVFVKDNAPANGELDWTKLYDYKTKFLELWGRK